MFPAFKQPERRQDDDAAAESQQQDRQPDLAAERRAFTGDRNAYPREQEHQQHERENDQARRLGIIPGDDKLTVNRVFIV